MGKKEFRILVADDDEIIRDVVTSLLSRDGYTVVAAKDGLGALKILDAEDVSFVISDLRMPGADGIEVLKHAVKKNPDISVVILTAFGTLDTTLEAINEGAYDYLTKPFKAQEILIVADRAYKRTMLIQENRELVKQLRDLYHDAEIIKAMAGNRPADWVERIGRLVALGVLSAEEAEDLKERLKKRDG